MLNVPDKQLIQIGIVNLKSVMIKRTCNLRYMDKSLCGFKFCGQSKFLISRGYHSLVLIEPQNTIHEKFIHL